MPDAKPAPGKGALGVLKRKVGPAPVWVWFAVGLLLFVVYRRFKGAGNNTGTTPITPSTSPGTTMDSSGTSGGGGQSSGAGMGVDPSQLLDAYRSGGSDYANIFGSLLPYFYFGGNPDYSSNTPGQSSNGAPYNQGGQSTNYIAQQSYENVNLYRQPYAGDILLQHPSKQAQSYGSAGTLAYGIQGGGGTQPLYRTEPGSAGIFLFK